MKPANKHEENLMDLQALASDKTLAAEETLLSIAQGLLESEKAGNAELAAQIKEAMAKSLVTVPLDEVQIESVKELQDTLVRLQEDIVKVQRAGEDTKLQLMGLLNYFLRQAKVDRDKSFGLSQDGTYLVEVAS